MTAGARSSEYHIAVGPPADGPLSRKRAPRRGKRRERSARFGGPKDFRSGRGLGCPRSDRKYRDRDETLYLVGEDAVARDQGDAAQLDESDTAAAGMEGSAQSPKLSLRASRS